tara:strand:+ start:593 stop:886 length:294 start_codon:yes stop_codon:yes gene_type:complete
MAIGGYPTAFILKDTSTVSVGASSSQSSALTNNSLHYRIVCSCDTHIEVGSNPTATTGSAMLPAYTIEYLVIPEGSKIAFLRFSTQSGTAYITECTR